MRQSFPIAPMSTGLRWLTIALFGLPVVFIGLGLTAPLGAALVLLPTGVMIAVLYHAIWRYWRPTTFDVEPAGLRIRFPGTEKTVPASGITGARVLTRSEFRSQYGWGMRIGAGGLWGGFGRLRTRSTTFEMYVSRYDRLVVVDRGEAMPLLITPEDPEEFATNYSR